ncbi:cofactor D [Kwoniella heveanensis BCC8398]|uniref:Cofactor D n=1 Tax=Kwoniella heveanensis BCC8398 TaxID=1296120 RepID=A0A1B9GJT7_9TREE|nr:cofactor D [Kwoniella heveanensis BCC8398]
MSKTTPSHGLEDDSDPTYTHFAHRSEFLALLERFRSLDIERESDAKEDEVEDALVDSLGGILDYYLPLPGLLDPSLDHIVPSLMEGLGKTLHRLIEAQESRSSVAFTNPKRLARLGRVLNWIVKVRGWKAVVPHFPSAIPNLPMLVTLLSPPTSPSSSTTPSTPQHPLLSSPEAWELRAVLLLWLALLLTVPFNLTALSDNSIRVSSVAYGIDRPSASLLFKTPSAELAQRVILLSIPLLSRPGKEGAYSALVLARLYSREDAVQGLAGFLDWAVAEIRDGEREGEAHLAASVFEFLALLPSLLKTQHLPLVEHFMEENLLPHLRGSTTAAGSGLIRKLAIKAKGRLWLAKVGRGRKGQAEDEEDADLPEGLEEWLDDLMGGLSDKDTIVRYSSAKYLARLSFLLPPSFCSQIVQATISLFQGTEDEPVTITAFGTVIDPGGSSTSGGTLGFGGLETSRGEARWHGVCLALAEMARRGLVDEEAIGEAVEWVVKALTFDLRRASHSIGANVRDAAAYLLWSLSRACKPKMLERYAESMATALVSVAVFDREVGVRRAASAAFQEGVGRLGLYPEGIDVLAKTDFYSVSVRRLAFTVAAPAVAVHKVYRNRMREHLHHITFRHWDTAMRVQGAQTLRSLLQLGEEVDLQDSIQREIKELPSLDASNVHGALIALTQISTMFDAEDNRRQQIFDSLSTIRPAALVSSQAADILSAIFELLVSILGPSILTQAGTQAILDRYIDTGMKRREPEVQESIARVYGRLSCLREPTKDVNKLVADLKTFRLSQRQTACLALGQVQYPLDSPLTEKAVKALVGILGDIVKMDIESRKYAARSLGDIAIQRVDAEPIRKLTPLSSIFSALLVGLDDYTTDQRGDVGSWVRSTALNSLGKIISSIPSSSDLVPQETLQQIIGGTVKQSVEKLESVRGEAALALARIRESEWTWEGRDALLTSVAQLQDEGFRYIDPKDWFASALPLLMSQFRPNLLAGLVYSVGSQVITLSDAAFHPLLDYLQDNPAIIPEVLRDLLVSLEGNYTSNRIFIPTLQTVYKLFSNGLFSLVQESSAMDELYQRILIIACKGLSSIKSIERITVSMRVVIAFLSAPTSARVKAVDNLPIFLGHRFPRIRALASEEVYLALSATVEDELPEELEETLLETDWVGQEYAAGVDIVVESIRGLDIQ